MIKTMNAILGAVFGGTRVSKNVKEKTRCASGLLTTLYAVLTILVFVIYYKTNRVATVVNSIDVMALRTRGDSMIINCDTIKFIAVYNSFSSSGTFEKSYFTYQKKRDDHLKYFEGKGGYWIYMEPHEPYSYIKNPYIPDLYYDNEYEHLPKDVGLCYRIDLISTNIPSFFPFYSSCEGINKEDTMGIYYDVSSDNTKNKLYFNNSDILDKEKPKLFDNGVVTSLIAANHKFENQYNNHPIDATIASEHINHMNVFTAADISQYYFCININTNYAPISEVAFVYNLPIEMVSPSSDISVLPRSFTISDLQGTSSRHYEVLVKLPTLANLQLIRSLILTTLLIGFASLFLTNLYYLVRRKIVSFHKSNRLSYRQAKTIHKQVHKFRKLIRILFILLLSFVILLALFIGFDATIIISKLLYDRFWIVVLLFFIFLFILIYCSYRNMLRPLKVNKKEKEPLIETPPPLLFTKDKTEEEELDDVFAKHIKDLRKVEKDRCKKNFVW